MRPAPPPRDRLRQMLRYRRTDGLNDAHERDEDRKPEGDTERDCRLRPTRRHARPLPCHEAQQRVGHLRKDDWE